MPKFLPARTRRRWWVMVALCALPTAVRWAWPTDRPARIIVNAQQFAFGSMMVFLVDAGVRRWRTLRRWDAGARAYATGQRRVACVFGCLIGIFLVFGAVTNRFSEFGGWVLLPFAFVGPILFATQGGGERTKRKRTE